MISTPLRSACRLVPLKSGGYAHGEGVGDQAQVYRRFPAEVTVQHKWLACLCAQRYLPGGEGTQSRGMKEAITHQIAHQMQERQIALGRHRIESHAPTLQGHSRDLELASHPRMTVHHACLQRHQALLALLVQGDLEVSQSTQRQHTGHQVAQWTERLFERWRKRMLCLSRETQARGDEEVVVVSLAQIDLGSVSFGDHFAGCL